MPILSGSRYSDSTTVQVVVNNATRTVITPSPAVPILISYILQIVTDRTTLQDLAESNYSDPTMWYVIANANPQILDWSQVPAGTIIRIPVLSLWRDQYNMSSST